MSRIEDILKHARRVLKDKDKVRWGDDDLLAILDECQKDLCKATNMLRDRITVDLKQHVHTYTLPEDTLVVYRTEYEGSKLPLRTTEYMDEKTRPEMILQDMRIRASFSAFANTWQTQTTEGEILCVIFDKLKRRQLRVWPIPVNELDTTQTTLDSPFGITVEMNGQALPGFGEVSFSSAAQLDSLYGVVVSVNQVGQLVVLRSKLPATLTALSDSLEVDVFCDTAMKYYVIGHAFKDDLKEENRAVGNDNLRRYYEELAELEAMIAGDSVQISAYDIIYDGMGK